jgi:shikimate kinase
MQKVVLVGYMGSGKSFIGKLLSEKTGALFLDLDQVIEQQENCTVKDYSKTKEKFILEKQNRLFLEI